MIWEHARTIAARRCGILWTPELDLKAVNPVSSTGQALPGYSPTSTLIGHLGLGEEEEATGNLCLGPEEAVQERVRELLGRAGQPAR